MEVEARIGPALALTISFVRSRLLLWMLLSVPISALAVLTRGYPTTDGDAGVFLSVAGRLVAGDKLYRDVFDNKDPLFYFSQLLGLWAAGWRGPFLLDIAWLIVASVGAHLLLWAITGDRVVAVFGQLLYPLLLTAILYQSHVGYSETPGLSLLPLLAYLVYRRRPTLAGFTAATTLLLKLNLLPVVAAIAVAGLAFSQERPRRPARELLAFVRATAVGVSLVFLVLVVRGEAGAYLESLRENASYAPRALRVVYGLTGIRGHLIVVRDKTPPLARELIVAVVALISGVMIAGAEVRTRLLRSQLAVLAVAASLGTLVMLAATALWSNHLEALAFPMFCGASLAVECARTGFRKSRRIVMAGAVGALAAYCILMALLLNRPALANLDKWTASPTTFVSDALQDAAARTNGLHSQLSYFHLGANDEMGQGAFLNSSFRLACPEFHQYPFTSPAALRETIRCMERTRPQLIAVTPSFKDWYGPKRDPAWIQFVLAGRNYVARRCRLAVVEPRVRVYVCGEMRR